MPSPLHTQPICFYLKLFVNSCFSFLSLLTGCLIVHCQSAHCLLTTFTCSIQVSQVEVYPGSGVLCDSRSWQAASQAQSPTAMARTLLMGVFDMNTLMNSNLRGGRSRRPAFHPQRSALDPHKINAIFSRFRHFTSLSSNLCLTLYKRSPLFVFQMPS